MRILHIDKLHKPFPGFDFGDADEDDVIFLDASQAANDSIQSSYYWHFGYFYSQYQ